jgi:transposase
MAVKKVKIRGYNNSEVLRLALAFDCSTQTIKRWINSNDDRLTSDKAKKALAK